MRLLLAFALIGCGPGPRPQPPDEIVKRIPVDQTLDLLFVIDNSASTADKQELFAQNFPRLVQALDAFPGGRPSLHVGVVSTTVGTGSDVNFGTNCPMVAPQDDGLLQDTPRITGCISPNGRYISDDHGTVNYSSTLASTFECIALLGTSGCGFEMPLEAMKRALDGSRPENAGFLRDDADLAIVFLTDEDDCSVRDPSLFSLNNVGPGDLRCVLYAYDCTPPLAPTAGTYTNCSPRTDSYLQTPQSYFDFLQTVKDRSQVAIAVIAGDPSPTITLGPITQPFMQALAVAPSCSATINSNPVIARPADRLDDFLTRYGERGLFRSICEPDYTPALADIGQQMFTMMSNCLEGPIDPATCKVSDATGPIPPCDATHSNVPCAWLAPSTSCATDTGLELEIERAAPPPPHDVIEIRCSPRSG